MDITQIDAVSYATRTGHVAAAELYGLLAVDDPAGPIPAWFDPAGMASAGDEAVAATVELLGAYVCQKRPPQGETLYLWAQQGHLCQPGAWDNLGIAGQQAFALFTDTCRTVFLAIGVAQAAIEAARREVGFTPIGLKLEDSIFKQQESLFTLRPEAIEAARLTENFNREQAAEHRRIRAQRQAEVEPFDGDDDGSMGGSKKGGRKRKPKPQPAPLSAGEAQVQPPVNRGGRGNRKAAGAGP